MGSHTELYLDATESESSKNSCTGVPAGVSHTSVDTDSVGGRTQGPGKSHEPLEHILSNDFKHVKGDISPHKHNMNSDTFATDQIDVGQCEQDNSAIKDIAKEIKSEAEQLFGIRDVENEDSKTYIDLNDTSVSNLLSSIKQLSKLDKERLLYLASEESRSEDESCLGSAVVDTLTANTHYLVEQTLVSSDNELRIESGAAPQPVPQAQPQPSSPPSPPQPPPQSTDVSNRIDSITVTDSSDLYISTESSYVPNTPREDILYPQDTSSGQIVVKDESERAEKAGSTLATRPSAFPVLDTQRRHKRIRSRRSRETMDFDSPEYKEYLKGLDQDSRKRELNKQAAKRCRDKKFSIEIELEQRAKRLRIQHEKLLAEKTRLVTETNIISFRLDKHNHCLAHQPLANLV